MANHLHRKLLRSGIEVALCRCTEIVMNLSSSSASAFMGQLPRLVFSSLSSLTAGSDLSSVLSPALQHVANATGAGGAFVTSLAHGELTQFLVQLGPRRATDRHDYINLQQCPWILSQLLGGLTVIARSVPANLPHEAAEDCAYLRSQSVAAFLAIPVPSRDGTLVLAIHAGTPRADWDGETADALRFVADLLASTLVQHDLHQQLNRAQADLTSFTQRVDSQVRALKDDVRTVHDFDEIVGDSPAFSAALAAVREVAPTDTTTLLLGETGTGKELIARAIHERSPRRHRPFVCVNCAALPASLIESELFGHERGAFTGAIASRQGRFELADRGTIFLDEIGDLPLDLQPKLLRVLQEQEFERVGSSTRRRIDVRVIAATHHDLMGAVSEGRFRADLYYRLGVFPISLPPLRERLDDIPQLVWFLVNRRQRRLHRNITVIPPATMDALRRYSWPGNVRELENIVERALIRSVDGTLRIDDRLLTPPAEPAAHVDDDGSLRSVERAHIEEVLRRCRGKINGVGNAAECLGLHPNTLRFRIKKLGITRQVALGQRPSPAVPEASRRIAH
jgi:formate hydrogenlyase transcriptional activator